MWQARACAEAGLELHDVQSLESIEAARPIVVFFDDVFFTEMAIRNFVAEVIGDAEDRSLALPDGGAWRSLGVMQDALKVDPDAHAFDIFYVAQAPAIESRQALRDRAKPLVLDAAERQVPVRMPPVEGAPETVAFTVRIAAHVRHWIHLLRLSQLAVGVLLAEEIRRHPRRLLWAKLRGRSGWKLARSLSFVHPSADVHPTADLEAAIIGPGSKIRAHAHVHYSVLGQDVEVGDHAVIMGCTLADQVQILRASYLALCASMPGSTLASYKVQLSLFGRGVFLTSSAWLIDAKLKGDIRVEHQGELVAIGSPFLGSCLGHGVTLGAQVAIQPGRSIPNGSTVVGPPEGFAGSVSEDASPNRVLTVRNGRIVPL